MYANAGINYTLERSTEEPAGQDFIPLAPDLTSSGGFHLQILGILREVSAIASSKTSLPMKTMPLSRKAIL